MLNARSIEQSERSCLSETMHWKRVARTKINISYCLKAPTADPCHSGGIYSLVYHLLINDSRQKTESKFRVSFPSWNNISINIGTVIRRIAIDFINNNNLFLFYLPLYKEQIFLFTSSFIPSVRKISYRPVLFRAVWLHSRI